MDERGSVAGLPARPRARGGECRKTGAVPLRITTRSFFFPGVGVAKPSQESIPCTCVDTGPIRPPTNATSSPTPLPLLPPVGHDRRTSSSRLDWTCCTTRGTEWDHASSVWVRPCWISSDRHPKRHEPGDGVPAPAVGSGDNPQLPSTPSNPAAGDSLRSRSRAAGKIRPPSVAGQPWLVQSSGSPYARSQRVDVPTLWLHLFACKSGTSLGRRWVVAAEGTFAGPATSQCMVPTGSGCASSPSSDPSGPGQPRSPCPRCRSPT